jgi:hypothetical protein
MSSQSQHILNFDAPAAHQAKLDGMERAENRMNQEWRRQMVQLGVEMARMRRTLTTDDLLREYAKDPSRPRNEGSMRSMSAVMRDLRVMKVIEPTGDYVKSERISNHACPIAVNRSLIFRG